MPRIRSQAEKYLTTVAQAHKGHLNINKPLPTITGILLGNALSPTTSSNRNADPRIAIPANTLLQVPEKGPPKQTLKTRSAARVAAYVPPVSHRAHIIISVMQFLEAEEKDMARELERVRSSIREARSSFEELKARRNSDLEDSETEALVAAGDGMCVVAL